MEMIKSNLKALNWVLILFVSLNLFIGAFMAQTHHLEYAKLSDEDKFDVWMGCIWVWTAGMIPFITSLGKRMKKGEDLFDDDPNNPLPLISKGDTVFTKKPQQQPDQIATKEL